MAMTLTERLQIEHLLPLGFVESDQPTAGNMAVFYDEKDTMVYAAIIGEWPAIIAPDIEWGDVEFKDASRKPFDDKKVRFFSPH
jgi:hypothetical protein